MDFINKVSEDPQVNYFNYGYIYNGGGVAVGDIDGDGLPDLYFSGTMTPNKLYRNLGNFQFEDITEQAGVAAAEGFKTGVLMVDVNGDGMLDLYVCRTGNGPIEERSNLLFINQGNGKFEEQSKAYGLDAPANTNHAVFFDYDGDGDLDCFWLNHPIRFGANTRPRLKAGLRYTEPETPYESDRLWRNDGGRFTDVTQQAGLSNSAFGLSVAVHDFNGDGLPDIFVANDYIEPDFLYINNGNGSFSDQSDQYFDLMSQNSMGSDAADLNDDGLLDLIVLDMLPETHARQKSLMSTMMLDRYQTLLKFGYGKQQMRNVLHMGIAGGGFSEQAHQAGIHATDWSWAALAADFNNDGLKDLFITNGYRRDVTDLDFIRYKNDSLRQDMPISELHKVLERIPSVRLSNYLYLQTGEGHFRDASASQGIHQPSFSNGAVYADLDGDGLLDLVVNNLEDPAFIYRNRGPADNHWLRIQLEGKVPNTFAIGAKVSVQTASGWRYVDQQPVRGYFSSVDPILHLGLGKDEKVLAIRVQWPDGRWSEGWRGGANRLVQIRYGDSLITAPKAESEQILFSAVDAIRFKHRENSFEDFKREFLLPRRLSREGPPMAVADFNGDGREDLFIGGATGQSAALYLQQSNDRFRVESPAAMLKDAAYEDSRILAFDANSDGHIDLYVGSGGYHAPAGDALYQDRLYLNDGSGKFRLATDALPPVKQPSSAVIALDWDSDGDEDLLLCGRAVPGRYPESPSCYLLENQGGKFVDVTDRLAPALAQVGMVTDALWLPVEGQALPDLYLCGEWMPIRRFRWQDGQLKEAPVPGLENSHGWWNRLIASDVNGDGHLDLLAGNLGRNSRFRPTAEQPMLMLAKDFDRNGQIDPVIFQTLDGVLRPVAGFDLLSTQLPYLRKRFSRYQAFARAGLDDIFPSVEQQGASRFEVHTLDSWILINDGRGGFRAQALHPAAQSFPLMDALAGDWDGDGRPDVLLAGNFFHLDIESGPITAGRGALLSLDESGAQRVRSGPALGLTAKGDVRSLAALRLSTSGKTLIVVGINDGESLSFTTHAPIPNLP